MDAQQYFSMYITNRNLISPSEEWDMCPSSWPDGRQNKSKFTEADHFARLHVEVSFRIYERICRKLVISNTK